MSYTRDDIASFYHLALHLQLVSKQAPIEWADCEILRSSTPDKEMIDLSLAANQPVDTVISILTHLVPQTTPTAFRLIASLMAYRIKSHEITEAQAANLLYRLYRWDSAAEKTLGSEVCYIDEWFEPWSVGPERASADVREFLRPYEGIELPPT